MNFYLHYEVFLKRRKYAERKIYSGDMSGRNVIEEFKKDLKEILDEVLEEYVITSKNEIRIVFSISRKK